jgi:hypothetical protein
VPTARHILSGDLLIDPFKGPGYELALVVFHRLFGEFFRSGMLLSVGSASLLLVALHAIMKRMFDADTALLVCLGTALNHAFLTMTCAVGTDMFFAMLAMCVVSLMTRVDALTRKALLIAGILAGYTYLTRYNGIAIIVAASTGILWLCESSIPWKRRIIDVSALMIGIALLVVPFGIYTLRLTGQFFYNLNYLNVAYEIYARQTIFWNDYWSTIAPYFHSYADVVAYDPVKFFSRLASNAATYAWKDLSSLVTLPIGILSASGLLLELRCGFTRMQAMLYLFGAMFFLVLLPVFYEERFSLFLVPFIVLFAVRFLQWIGARTYFAWNWKRIARGVTLGLALWCFAVEITVVKNTIASEPREILLVGESFFKLNAEERRGSNIAARKPQIAYYLNLDFADWPQAGNLSEFVSGLQQSRVDFLFFRQIDVKLCPELSELLDPMKTHKGLRPVVIVQSPLSILYRVEAH